MGAGPVVICCVCDDNAAEGLEKTVDDAIHVLNDEKPPPLSHHSSHATLPPNR